MILINLNGAWRAISPKAAPKMEIGEKKTFTSWEKLADFGRSHSLSDSNFNLRSLGAGWVLERLK